MNTQTFIAYVREHTFVPVDLREEIVDIADSLSDQERADVVQVIEDMGCAFLEAVEQELRAILSLEKEARHEEEELDREQELASLPSFDDA